MVEAVADRDRLWELSEDLLVVAGFDGRLQRVSPSWTRLLGHHPEWLLTRAYLDLVHPDDKAAVSGHLDRLRASGAPMRHECRLRRIDNSWRWVAWTFTIDPSTERIHGVGRDVTSDRETTEALRHAEEALRRRRKWRRSAS